MEAYYGFNRMPSYQTSSFMITNNQERHSKQKERASNLKDRNSSDNNLNESNKDDRSSTTKDSHDQDPAHKN